MFEWYCGHIELIYWSREWGSEIGSLLLVEAQLKVLYKVNLNATSLSPTAMHSSHCWKVLGGVPFGSGLNRGRYSEVFVQEESYTPLHDAAFHTYIHMYTHYAIKKAAQGRGTTRGWRVYTCHCKLSRQGKELHKCLSVCRVKLLCLDEMVI